MKKSILLLVTAFSILDISAGCKKSHHTCDPTGTWRVDLVAQPGGTCVPDYSASTDKFIIQADGEAFRVVDLTDQGSGTVNGSIEDWSCRLIDESVGIYNPNFTTAIHYKITRDFALSGGNDEMVFGRTHWTINTVTPDSNTTCDTDWLAGGTRSPEEDFGSP